MRNIQVGGFTITRRQKTLVNKVLDSTRLTYGPMTQKFEKMWAELHEVKYALFCNSGTSALQVAIHALKDQNNWQDNDEVIIPAVTFVATMNVVVHNNLKPVLVDVEKDYYNIDPTKIEAAITPKTRAIIAVHLLGQPAQMDKIMKIAKKHKLKVIEDSCECVGVSYMGKRVGSWGDVACFSTYASHLVVTGVGGFACTDDDDLAIRIKGLYNHGRDGIYNSIDDNKKGIEMIASRFNFVHSGYSYRLTEMESALGIGHMERFKKELDQRRVNAEYLIALLKPLERKKYLKLPKTHPKAGHSFMLFGIVISPKYIREGIIEELEGKGIATRYMMPLMPQVVTKKLLGHISNNYPVAQHIDDNGFLLGMHAELSKADLKYVAKSLYECFNEKI